MKNIIKHTISFSMILILLVSTLQISLYKMECIMTGNTLVSLSEFDDCNQPQENSCSVSEKCCNFNNITFDFDYNTNVNLKTFKSTIATTFSLQQCVDLVAPIIKISNFNNYTNLPPPGGLELLKRVQVFRL